jgi:hypothetical protein
MGPNGTSNTNCPSGTRAVDSSLQCESAAAQLGYKWQENSIEKSGTWPLGCYGSVTTAGVKSFFWNVGNNSKWGLQPIASPVCVAATAGTS